MDEQFTCTIAPPERFCVFISKSDITDRTKELAVRIAHAHPDSAGPLYCVAILNGAVVFATDLLSQLACHIRTPMHFDTIRASSYEGTESSGNVEVNFSCRFVVRGSHILVIEDIVDTGRTMDAVLRGFWTRGAADLKVCTLLNKPDRRLEKYKNMKLDHVGFSIPDKFVVGYGLDYRGLHRFDNFISIRETNEHCQHCGEKAPRLFSHLQITGYFCEICARQLSLEFVKLKADLPLLWAETFGRL